MNSLYPDEDGFGANMKGNYGYKITSNGKNRYFMFAPRFKELARGANRNELLQQLADDKWVMTNYLGKAIETKSFKGHNQRGYIFDPSAWEGHEESIKVTKDLTLPSSSSKQQDGEEKKSEDKTDNSSTDSLFDDVF